MDAALDTDAEMQARHARTLGRLAELGMALAENLQARALVAEDPAQAAQLAAGFHRLSRSVRQSLALEARLRRDERRARREEELQGLETDARAPARRRAEVKAALDRLVWTEAETLDIARHWSDGVPRLLAEAELREDFATRPVAEVIAELAEALREAEPPALKGKPGEPETVIFEWKIVDPPDRYAPRPPPDSS